MLKRVISWSVDKKFIGVSFIVAAIVAGVMTAPDA